MTLLTDSRGWGNLPMELKTPAIDGCLPERHEAIFMSGIYPDCPVMTGVRGYKALRRTNNSACSIQVLSPRRQGGLKSYSGYGNAVIEGFSMTAISSNTMNLSIVDGRPVASSLDVAARFGKLHKNVLRDIQSLECSEEFRRLNFEPASKAVQQPNGGTRKIPAYNITRDGFTFLAMGFTGKEAAHWKELYIAAFNAMEAKLLKAPAKPSAAIREQSEKRRLVAECRKVMGPRAAQAMWRDLGLPVQAPDQNELTLSAIPVGRLESDGRYLVVVHSRTVTEVRELANHSLVDGRSASNAYTFLREFLASDLLAGALDIIMHRLNARAEIAKTARTSALGIAGQRPN